MTGSCTAQWPVKVAALPWLPAVAKYFAGSTQFVVTDGSASGPARFIFAGEDGTISGWNPGVPPPATSSQAFVAVTTPDAIYKGLAIDGLWALAFGNGVSAGPTNTLFFTAGPFDEAHGLFGSLVVTDPPRGRHDEDTDDSNNEDDSDD
jgi:hypothetical protein